MSICDTSVSFIYKDAAAAIASHVHGGAQEANGWAAVSPCGKAELWCGSAIDGLQLFYLIFSKK